MGTHVEHFVRVRVKHAADLVRLADGSYRASHEGLGLIAHAATAEEATAKIQRAWDFMYGAITSKKGGYDRLVSEYSDALELAHDPKRVGLSDRVLDPV